MSTPTTVLHIMQKRRCNPVQTLVHAHVVSQDAYVREVMLRADQDKDGLLSCQVQAGTLRVRLS
jgi:hypothetical protein